MEMPLAPRRSDIRILDCTIRDGGLINDHRFDDALVRAVYRACLQAGVDYLEIGYKASRRGLAVGQFGDWKFCQEDALRRIVGENPTPLKLSVMADAGKTDWRTDLVPKDQSVIDLVRVACYGHQISEAVDMIKDAHDKGYEVSCNLMAVSTMAESALAQALAVLAQTPAETVVVVDSNGALYPPQVRALVRRYRAAMIGTGKEIGIHTHNNLQLAFANTVEAIQGGATRVDATMAGLGRGAGNCPMELLLGFLREPRYRLRPVLSLLQEYFVPLRAQLEWGPLVPYNLTGQFNLHPRSAIAARTGADKDNFAAFYDQCLSQAAASAASGHPGFGSCAAKGYRRPAPPGARAYHHGRSGRYQFVSAGSKFQKTEAGDVV